MIRFKKFLFFPLVMALIDGTENERTLDFHMCTSRLDHLACEAGFTS
jgi:hypothetical protein